MSIEAQLQIRNNAMEVQDYMSDLLSWEKQVKKKDKAVSKGASSITCASNATTTAPRPPRGQAAPAQQPATVDMQQPALTPSSSKPASSKKHTTAAPADPNARHAAAHTYEHWKKWDKFDPDADGDDDTRPTTATRPPKRPPPSNPSSTGPPEPRLPPPSTTSVTPQVPKPRAASHRAAPSDPSLPPVRQPPPAPAQPTTPDDWKNRGNDLFKAGDYSAAIDCYSRAIALLPTAAALSNRAMAALKLRKHQDAEHDCDHALLLDPAFLKAYHRRGTARRALGNLLGALDDFDYALRLEPTNKTLRADRDALFAQICADERLGPQPPLPATPIPVEWAVAAPAPVPTSHGVPPQATSPQPPAAPPAARPAPAAPGLVPTPPAIAEQFTAPAAASPPPRPPTSTPPTPSPLGPIQPPATATTPPTSRPPSAAPSPRAPRIPSSLLASVDQAAARALAGALRPPTTSTEFEATWRSLRDDPHLQSHYLSLIPPANLPAIFKSSMTPQVLSTLLRTILSSMAASTPPPLTTTPPAPSTATPGTTAPNPTPSPLPTTTTAATIVATATSSSSSRSSDADASGNESGMPGLTVEAGAAWLQRLPDVERFMMNAMCLPLKERAALGALWGQAMAALGTDRERVAALEALRPKYRL